VHARPPNQTSTPDIRPARQADAAAIGRIYEQAIEERSATFRTDPWTVQEIEAWIALDRRFPVLVAQGSEGVLGWVRIVAYSEAEFYDGVAEYVLYVGRSARRRGVGRTLLEAICEEAEGLGYWKLVGKLFATNEPSIRVAHACGFRDVGIHLRHGQLDGEWKDVLVVERLLGPARHEDGGSWPQ
jgi:L-amino acid N-acyltransferase YncA